MSAEAAFTAVDFHAVKEEFCHSIPNTFRTFGKCFYKHGGIAFLSGAPIQYHNSFTHIKRLVSLKFFLPEQPPAGNIFSGNTEGIQLIDHRLNLCRNRKDDYISIQYNRRNQIEVIIKRTRFSCLVAGFTGMAATHILNFPSTDIIIIARVNLKTSTHIKVRYLHSSVILT